MKRIFAVAGLLFLINQYGSSQNNSFNKPPVNFMSADAANLGKHGTYNVNHYTGTPSISVPVYEINEMGVSIPITLSYDASGFIPNKNSGIVGQNWSLSTGGAITRVVKGVPDEKHNPNPEGDDVYTKENDGYIYGIRNNMSTNPSQSTVENLTFLSASHSYVPGYPAVTGTEVKFEYNPDIFSFNFLGHSGTFVMGNDGTVKVNSDRRYKVDLTGLKDYNNIAQKIDELVQNQQLNSYDFSTIKLTDDQGYEYYFGGKLSTIELSFNYLAHDDRAVKGNSGVISAWYLKKIVAPNNDEITFDYGSYTDNEQDVLRHISELNGSAGNWDTKEAIFFDIRLFWKDHKVKFNFANGSNSGNQPLAMTKSLIKTVYLKKIDTKLRRIEFSYSKRNEYNQNKFYTTQSGGTDFETFVAKNPLYFTQKLDHISVIDKVGVSRFTEDGEFIGQVLNFDFIYQFYGNSTVGNRLFLKEFVSNVQTKYKFDYWRTGDLQHPLTAALDKWGFYNGQNNSTLVGVNGPVYGDPAEFETNFTYAGQNRTASPANANIGLLQKITYPTGGTTDFEFEGHKISKVLKKKVNATGGNSIIPEWVTLVSGDDDNVGGCRIKKIINTPGVTTEFKYIKNYDQNPAGPSSGLLTDYGVFKVRYERGGGTGHYHEQLFDQNISQSSGFSESHICYSEVAEVIADGSEGFTKYTFVNPDDQAYGTNASPDNYFLGSNTIYIYGTAAHVASFENQMKRLSRYSSRSTERGKLWKREVYNSANTLLKSSEYKYNTDPARFSEKTVGYERIFNLQMPPVDNVQDYGFFIQSFQIYHYHTSPSQIIEKDFSNGQTLTQTTNFTYKGNSNPLLTEKIMTRSDGTVFKSQYFYPEDRVGNPEFPASSAMVSANMVSAVVEEKNYQGTTLLATNKYIYSDVTGTGDFKPVQMFSTNHTISGAVAEEGMNITYYTDGNVKESFKKNDYKTGYLWDYKMSYPIAEVKNIESAADISFTSFETNETWAQGGYNQWVYNVSAEVYSVKCPTGSKVYDLNFNSTAQTVTRSGLNAARQYIISLWFNGTSLDVSGLTAQNGASVNGWVYKEYLVTGLSSITISGTGKIDELRLYPKGAQMSTYTYHPLLGVITQCDANNRTSYYSYDINTRLRLIKDKDFNIIKQFCYNYFDQPVNCSNVVFKSSVTSQSFTKNDCPEGYTGSTVTYTVPASKYGSSNSQAEADSLAQKDIYYYGQQYANENGTCTFVCGPTNCSGPDKKCKDNVCITGTKKYISSTYSRGVWTCVYVYEWSDCSVSQQYTEENASPCNIVMLCGD